MHSESREKKGSLCLACYPLLVWAKCEMYRWSYACRLGLHTSANLTWILPHRESVILDRSTDYISCRFYRINFMIDVFLGNWRYTILFKDMFEIYNIIIIHKASDLVSKILICHCFRLFLKIKHWRMSWLNQNGPNRLK